MRQKTFYPVFLWSLIAIIVFVTIMYAVSGLTEKRTDSSSFEIDESDSRGSFYTIQTENGETLIQTSWPIRSGDQFLSAENQWYELKMSKNNTPVACPVRPPSYFHPAALNQAPASNPSKPSMPPLAQNALISPSGEEREVHVIIYHTHSDESYGYGTNITSKPGNGDVYEVGEHLSKSLRELGASVSHSYAKHDPHDRSAYERSRETLIKLLPEQPDLVIDLHRDSAPVSSYVTTINGQLTARVMLVVGAANPNMETNLRYAYAFKETADRIYPNLVRGIYIGKGSYNQDLYPSAMLMEFGTEGMSRDTAEKAAACITDVLQTFLMEALPALAAADNQ